jgi:uncharacterized protein (TIGR03790 family)
MAKLCLALAAGLLAGCSGIEDSLNSFQAKTRPVKENPQVTSVPVQAPSPKAKRVLVVYNSLKSTSTTIAKYYAGKRGVPESNLLALSTESSEGISASAYRSTIEEPVRKAIGELGSKYDYILLTKGVPIRVDDLGGRSVDSLLAAMYLPAEDPALKTGEVAGAVRNPYYRSPAPFSAAKFKMHLVTRLDGYSTGSAIRLADLSLQAKPLKGPFFLDGASNRSEGDYAVMEKLLEKAANNLKTAMFQATYHPATEFVAPDERLMGYASWGSNDGAFDLGAYRRLRFHPGALAETYVSTSGRTFLPTEGGQSLIADLIEQGVTGVKGYVSEPYTFALAEPPILFIKYVSGSNLAESFYAASKIVRWKDVVIGDPLCAPYAKP